MKRLPLLTVLALAATLSGCVVTSATVGYQDPYYVRPYYVRPAPLYYAPPPAVIVTPPVYVRPPHHHHWR